MSVSYEDVCHVCNHILAALVVWPIALLSILWTLIYFGPTLEAKYFPILQNQSVTDVTQEGNKVCWLWVWEKERNAHPERFLWTVSYKGIDIQPLVVFRRDDNEPIITGIPRPTGLAQVNLCTFLPQHLVPLRGMSIKGVAVYRVHHDLWTIEQNLPVVYIK